MSTLSPHDDILQAVQRHSGSRDAAPALSGRPSSRKRAGGERAGGVCRGQGKWARAGWDEGEAGGKGGEEGVGRGGEVEMLEWVLGRDEGSRGRVLQWVQGLCMCARVRACVRVSPASVFRTLIICLQHVRLSHQAAGR